jgi:hypothetical protein
MNKSLVIYMNNSRLLNFRTFPKLLKYAGRKMKTPAVKNDTVSDSSTFATGNSLTHGWTK